MSEAYPPNHSEDPSGGTEDRLIASAPEDDMIRLANADLPEMKPIPVHVQPAETEVRAGDQP